MRNNLPETDGAEPTLCEVGSQPRKHLADVELRSGYGGRATTYAAVAQLVEHVSRKDGVIGSSPIGGSLLSVSRCEPIAEVELADAAWTRAVLVDGSMARGLGATELEPAARLTEDPRSRAAAEFAAGCRPVG